MVVLAVILIVGVLFYVYYDMEIDRKQKGYELYFPLQHIDGIHDIKKDVETIFYLYPDKITFNNVQTLPLSRVKKTEVITEKQINEKQKSVIKRAVAGGIILGPLGALVGSASGIGTKKVQENIYMFSIDFINKDNEESSALFLIKSKSYVSIAKHISDRINSKIGYIPTVTGKSYEI
jgi:hypothetical protein